MYDKLSFTLDSIIYRCDSSGKDDIEIILPRKAPDVNEYKSKFTNERSTVIQPAVQVEIKVFLTLTTNKIPKLYIHGADKKSKINYASKIELQANTINLLTFATTNGGSDWLVKNTPYSKNPADLTPGSKDAVTSVNNKKGPTIILDGSDIHLAGNTGPTIVQQFNVVENKIVKLQETIKSDVTNEVASVLPNEIRIAMEDTEIIAETI